MTAYSISYSSYLLVAASQKDERVDVSVLQNFLGFIASFLGTLFPTLLLVGDSDTRLIIPLFSGVVLINAVLYFTAARQLKDKQELYVNDLSNAEATLVQEIKQHLPDVLKSKAFLITSIRGLSPQRLIATTSNLALVSKQSWDFM